tara:strand:+ start:718 stop:852 length:135 start_codon:yes stop_codon:yes gene_type:complete
LFAALQNKLRDAQIESAKGIAIFGVDANNDDDDDDDDDDKLVDE